jgi:hypothetical protein
LVLAHRWHTSKKLSSSSKKFHPKSHRWQEDKKSAVLADQTWKGRCRLTVLKNSVEDAVDATCGLDNREFGAEAAMTDAAGRPDMEGLLLPCGAAFSLLPYGRPEAK